MITDSRILLRAWERTDLDAFVRWFNDPEVTVYIGDAYPALSVTQEERFMEQNADDRHRYCIVTRPEGALIGNCHLFHLDWQNRSAEVGIVIGEKSYWSQGYGREVLRLMQEIAFEGLGLHRLWLRHVDFNDRGHRCYQAAGFAEEGRLRQAVFLRGGWHDDIYMSILVDEYLARKQAEST